MLSTALSNKYPLAISPSASYIPSLVSLLDISSSIYPTDVVILVTLSNDYKTCINRDSSLKELNEIEINEFESIININIDANSIYSTKVKVTSQTLIPSSVYRRFEVSYNILRIDYTIFAASASKSITQDFF